jgi:hypothetical protein
MRHSHFSSVSLMAIIGHLNSAGLRPSGYTRAAAVIMMVSRPCQPKPRSAAGTVTRNAGAPQAPGQASSLSLARVTDLARGGAPQGLQGRAKL